MRNPLAIIAVLGLLPAGAQAASERELLATYCKSDIERLCANVAVGNGNIRRCLHENQKEMSVGCAKALQTLKDDQN